MSLNVKESNGRKIYILSENKSFSQYLLEGKKNTRKMKTKPDIVQNFELINDF